MLCKGFQYAVPAPTAAPRWHAERASGAYSCCNSSANMLAGAVTNLPGVGVKLGAEFLAITAGDLASFGSPDRLAALAGVAPAPRDS